MQTIILDKYNILLPRYETIILKKYNVNIMYNVSTQTMNIIFLKYNKVIKSTFGNKFLTCIFRY